MSQITSASGFSLVRGKKVAYEKVFLYINISHA